MVSKIDVDHPWMTSFIKNEINLRKTLNKEKRKEKDPEKAEELLQQYLNQKKKVQELIKKATANYESNINKEIESAQALQMKPKTEDKSPQGADKEKTQGDSDQEMLNLNTEIYSLTHYADDEEELVAQMFATIKGSKLEAMMPPILKEIPLIDVQQLCLHELRGMSQRRILSIINGQEMSGSSSDEDSEDDKKLKVQDENDDLNLGVRMTEEEEALASEKDTLAELENVNESNLTALDILELEMRAKLIKTMLDKQDGEENNIGNGFVPDIKIKEEPLTPESTRVEEDDDQQSSSGQHRKKYSHRRRSRSRSYSSSFSRSSSYSSRSSTRSRRRRSRSESRSGSSSDRKLDSSGSQESKKPTKKKITKREFEARMKKARMNRSYRKRKDSEDDSGGDKKKKGKLKKKAKAPSSASPEGGEVHPTEEEENVPKEDAHLEDGEGGEITEKEEGEIDSNEEGAISSSGSRSRSRSYSSFSSYSSRSRSYSRSPRRRSSRRSRRKKSRKSRHRHRSGSSQSVSDGPKVPNWQQSVKNPLPVAVTEKPETDPSIKEDTLPVKEDRQSVSFSFSKKSAPIKSNPELNDDGLPIASISVSTQSRTDIQEREATTPLGRSASPIDESVPSQKTDDVPKENSTTNKSLEVMEDFYKGADQLDFSEEEPAEGEEEVDLDNFLHDDTPVEPINVGEATQRKSIKVVSNKDELASMSWENKKKKDREIGDVVMEGDGFLKTALSEVPSDSSCAAEEDNEGPKEESWPLESSNAGEESSMDVVEPLPETEADDSQGSHSLDIIGVIDPKDAEDQEEMFNEGGSSSWSMRWLQSEKVQKVVSNSKILSKMRKNIQAKGKAVAKEKPKIPVKISPPIESKPVVETPVKKIEVKPSQSKSGSNVIGSLEEYEKLFGIKVKAPTSLPQPKPTTRPSIPAGLLDSDEDEDSEEEALWSTIMKK